MIAMHHGAVVEEARGSDPDEAATMVTDARAALALLRGQLRPSDVVLVKASNAVGLGKLADALVADVVDQSRGVRG
jgi:UDP-N-acetylmuramoyl-tripeptide--D-alanyl-D-alanine ligase